MKIKDIITESSENKTELDEKWSQKYKRSIDCSHPKGFSQRAHCQGRKKKVSEDINTPGEYVYHASYLPNLSKGLHSIISKGLKPSKTGYFGPGVYFAYDPQGGYYHVNPDEATMFRVRWEDLVKKYGTFPENKDGIQRDQEQIIVPSAVPAEFLEIEYFPNEWWDLESAYRASLGPIDEDSMSLHDWFGKGKHGGAAGGGWDRYNTKGERIGKCGDRKPGEGKPKCLSKARAASLRASGGKKAIAAAVRKKRREDPNPEKRGKAEMVSNKTRSKK